MKLLFGLTLLVGALAAGVLVGRGWLLLRGLEAGSQLEVRAALALGANPNQSAAFSGGHPLYPQAPPYERPVFAIAVERGQVAMVRLLIRHGVAFDARDAAGETPLFAAVRNNNLELVDILIQRGADPLAIQRLAENSKTSPPEWAQKLPENSLLHEASHRGIVKYLLHLRVDARSRNRLGETPLFGKEDPRVIQMLVAARSNVNAKDKSGRTPLSTLLCGNPRPDYEAVRTLLELGASTTIPLPDGKPLASCIQDKNSALPALLAQHGPTKGGKVTGPRR